VSSVPRVHAAVLGFPIEHSLSPVLHRAAYAALGLDEWTYEALACEEAGLELLVRGFAAEGTWAGLSLTMPLKTVAVELCDEVTTSLGAINTIVFDGDRLLGHNTDVEGIEAGLGRLRAAGADLRRVALLGAGGTARAAVEALGRSGTTHLSIHVISTLPGPAGTGIEIDGPLLDVVYDPWPTALARSAAGRGHPVVGGLDVLIGQAARQVTLMTGLDAPVEDMRAAGESELARRNG
jgi:shikimate dehydrogenase